MRRRVLTPANPDLTHLWRHCRMVTTDPVALAWLAERRIDPQIVVARELARVIPGRQLMVPLYGAFGEMRALGAHDLGERRDRIVHGDPEHSAVMANGIARQLLAQTLRSSWSWRTVLVVGGLPRYLEWAAALGSSHDAPAVFGVLDHDPIEMIAARTPDGCRVLIRGPAPWSDELERALGGRCTLVVKAE